MIDVADALAGAGASSRVLLQIHDELLLEVAPGDADEVERIVRDKMGRAVELSVPLEVSVGARGDLARGRPLRGRART